MQPTEPNPDPRYGPGDVIRLQIEALRRNDQPTADAGIATAFRFASPANQVVTGPLEHFTQMVHNPLYEPLLGHIEARYGLMQVEGRRVTQMVIVTSAQGERCGYQFTLTRQQGGPFNDCWMTDGVMRFELSDESLGLDWAV